MALKTQGFALSALPRAPRIPGNVGVVDVKAIYDGVKQGLDAFETARRAPRSMLLADAQMQAQTEQAPLATRGVLAQTEAAEAQGPLNTAILAERASPERIELERQALLARSAPKPLTGIPYLLERASQLERASIENPNDPILASALADTRAQLTKERDLLAAKTASQESIAMDRNATAITTAAGRDATQLATTDANNVARTAIADADRASRELIARSQMEHKTALASAKTDAQRAAAGSKARQALMVGEDKNNVFNTTVSRAIDNLSGGTGVVSDSAIPGGAITGAVIRNIAALFPGSDATDLKGLVKTLQAYAGFDELKAMRAAAPGSTGASGLGQITEKELAFLQSLTANLEFSQSDKQLYDNIITLRDAVNTAWKNARSAYEFDYGPRRPITAADAPNATPDAPVVSAEEKAAAAQWLQDNPNDPRAPAVRAKAGL